MQNSEETELSIHRVQKWIKTRAGFSLNRALFRKKVGPLIRAGVRQLAALFIVFKVGSSSGGPGKGKF